MILNFHPVLNAVCFLLGNSPTSEFYIPTFRNTLLHLHRRISAYEDGTECSETSAYKIQTSGNYPEESIQHSEHGESLKSSKRTKLSDLFVVPTGVKFLTKNLVPTQRGSTVKVISQTSATVVSASTMWIELPPASFGFFKQITGNYFI